MLVQNKPGCILIVEDSPLQARIISDLLQEQGLSADHATTAEEALQWIAKTTYDLILMDMVLPDMSGFQLLKKFKNIEACRDVAIIVISGATDKENVVEALSDGASDYITKPYHKMELITRIKIQLALRSSVKEKEMLLKEIHHRVKNNMQIVASLMDLQSDLVLDQSLKDVFAETKNRIRSMALVHEQLYQGRDMNSINFKEYMDNLLYSIADSLGSNHTFTIDINTTNLNINMALPCGLIINELISNSIKHAFPNHEPGTISVGMNKTESNQIILSVQDNGIGMPPGRKDSKSLGLKIIETLTKQLKGTWEVHSNQGTKTIITFPEKENR